MIAVWWNRLLAAFAAVAGIMLTATAVLIATGIVTRYLFNYPLGWASEVGGYALLYAAFLSAPWILAKEGHVSVDLVLEAMSGRRAALLNAVTSLLGVFVFAYVAYLGAGSTWQAYVRGYPMPTVLAYPRYLLLAVIPLGSGLLALEFAHRSWRFWTAFRHGAGAAEPTVAQGR